MKKLTFLTVILTTLVIMIIAVGMATSDDKAGGDYIQNNKFEVISSGFVSDVKYYIVYDKDTGVIYYMSCGSYNNGNLSPLYDTDGKLLLYGVGE